MLRAQETRSWGVGTFVGVATMRTGDAEGRAQAEGLGKERNLEAQRRVGSTVQEKAGKYVLKDEREGGFKKKPRVGG